MCLWIWLLVLHDCSHQNPDCSVAQVKWISYGESNPSSFAACCVAACVVLFVVLREEFADSRAGFRCHPSNMLQKTLLPFHWWCQNEVGPAPSGGMFTWRAWCCLCRNKPSLMPRRLLLSKEKKQKTARMTLLCFLSPQSCNLCQCQCHKCLRAFDFAWAGAKCKVALFFSSYSTTHD